VHYLVWPALDTFLLWPPGQGYGKYRPTAAGNP
jgi:hypothetical protein